MSTKGSTGSLGAAVTYDSLWATQCGFWDPNSGPLLSNCWFIPLAFHLRSWDRACDWTQNESFWLTCLASKLPVATCVSLLPVALVTHVWHHDCFESGVGNWNTRVLTLACTGRILSIEPSPWALFLTLYLEIMYRFTRSCPFPVSLNKYIAHNSLY